MALGLAVAGILALSSQPARADALDDAKKLFEHGQYDDCIRQAQQAIDDGAYDEEWPLLLARAQMAEGKYPEAQATIVAGTRRYSSSFQLLLEAHDVYNANGQTDRANTALEDIGQMLTSLSTGRQGSRLRTTLDPPSMVALGKALLLMKVDPKLVLNNFYDQVKTVVPDFRDSYLASGELALKKEDYQLAQKSFNDALSHFPDDPDAEFGLARAFAPSDAERMGTYLQAVLEANPHHVPAMLLLVDHLIDAEEYGQAKALLDQVKQVNPWDLEAWAYRAVIAHLQNETNAEVDDRNNALKYWSTNPRVDELIGTKLSQNYRFLEGSQHERQALEFDPDYLPAKIQLAQDLLRLGQEDEGWKLAQQVHDGDGYDVTAFNLVTLRREMSKYKTITNRDFIVRMATNEAALYGDQVLELLQRVRDTVTKKYNYEPGQPTYVEIFSAQKDFGVRTFGMPHNPGFLGVCFGNVITANSPAAQAGNAENWQDVLWHEFCHVITLGITHNQMPRWLSEGISVYEERQASPVWGMRMNPRFREMILSPDLTPVSQLSSAFMTPKSPYHVQFAYYESSLVVEFIVQKYGFASLRDILTDLGNGANVNDAIAKHTEKLDQFETDFAAYAKGLALNLAPGLDWTRPESAGGPGDMGAPEVQATNESDMDIIKRLLRRRQEATNAAVAATGAAGTNGAAAKPNYWKLLTEARTDLENQQWQDAKEPLQKLIDLYPTQTGEDSAYAMLAAADRQLKQTNDERDVLIQLTSLEGDDTEAFGRLMELDAGQQDWKGAAENAERFLAVNPLLAAPYRELARASEKLGDDAPAIRSYERLLLLDPPDPADIQYRLARLLQKEGDLGGAKRHVLESLEEAPRFPEALSMLLELEGTAGSGKAAPETP